MTKGFKALVQDRQKALHEGDTDVQTTAQQDKSPTIATESIILPVQNRQDRRKQLKAVVEDNQDNDRTTTIQVTLV